MCYLLIVLAVTAAGPRESSYAYYCDFSETDPYKTCLSDLFSAMWMENIDIVCHFNNSFLKRFIYICD